MADFRTVTPEQLYALYLEKKLEPETNGISIFFNMVASMDGVTTIRAEEHGVASDRGLSNPVDQKIMRILRFHADCVLNGANTLRISSTTSEIGDEELVAKRKDQGKSENPIAAVVTGTGEFSEQELSQSFFTDTSFESIVFAGAKTSDENVEKIKKAGVSKKLTVERLSDREEFIHEVVGTLQTKYHVKTLLVEGGSTVNGSFIRNGFGDHFFLTESPNIVIQDPTSHNAISGKQSFLKDKLINLQLESAYFVEEIGCIFQDWKMGTL